VEVETYRTRFQPALEQLKQQHFPHSPDEPVILHRKEIINCSGPFWRLRQPLRQQAFNMALLQFLHDQDYLLITVVIDKKAHVERYGVAALHPYHHCLAALLERYCAFLNRFNAQGDVMAESRGGTEDSQLKAAYQNLYHSGTHIHDVSYFQRVLTSKELKLKHKSANVAGLQVADLLAYPGKQHILGQAGRIADSGDTFGEEICRAVAAKHNRRVGDGRVAGYGQVFLR
jgi:hypothetical protein